VSRRVNGRMRAHLEDLKQGDSFWELVGLECDLSDLGYRLISHLGDYGLLSSNLLGLSRAHRVPKPMNLT
jgi:hypothetical protein